MTEKQFMKRKVQFKFKMTIDTKKAKNPEKAPLFMFAMFLKAIISIFLITIAELKKCKSMIFDGSALN